MDGRSFTVGKPYYLLTFLDEEAQSPSIDTFVFLGVNILGEWASAEGTRWYFQTADSFITDGQFDVGTNGSTDQLLIADADMLEAFLDVAELADNLLSVTRP
jgi:hypothetical protein